MQVLVDLFKKKIFNSPLFYKLRLKYLLPLGIFDKLYIRVPLEDGWKERIQDVMDCPDNQLIKRHPQAGMIRKGKQVMHNGIKVTLGGYYGESIVKMLYQNKGVHEPQEEYAFGEVLKKMPAGGTMIELGAYWSFYSIWFNKEVKDAINYMVEPGLVNMQYGINNFKLNNVYGKFTNAFIGRVDGRQEGIPVICIDDYVTENGITFIDILHSDIQGFEYEMLLGASHTIDDNKIGYIFISTHGDEVHYKCLEFLQSHNFSILCSADAKDTYSVDGLIVARSNSYPGIEMIDISLKTKLITA